MKKKYKGFSLAELLISLLIISIVLSAAIPAVTKRAGQQREYIWRWTEQNHVAYSAVGANQSVILGFDVFPMKSNDASVLLNDKSVSDTINSVSNPGVVNTGGVKFNEEGDKLVILKRKVSTAFSNLVNSHISFFNSDGSNIEYGGRLSLDSSNIALGIGSLQSIEAKIENKEFFGENTAIGHFSLLRNTTGYRNTAIGKKTLSFNEKGINNTAVGFASLFSLGIPSEGQTSSIANEGNTASGTQSLMRLKNGNGNTAIGYNAMKELSIGSDNTVIGANAMPSYGEMEDNIVIGSKAFENLIEGEKNTIIGTKGCRYLTKASNTICIGNETGNLSGLNEDKNGLYIGGTGDEEPLITGHTKKTSADDVSSDFGFDKELVVNARRVKFQPYNGISPAFEFEAKSGYTISSDGYDSAGSGIFGIARFNLRDTGRAEEASGRQGESLSLVFDSVSQSATESSPARQMVKIDAINPYTNNHALAPLSLNDKLSIVYAEDTPDVTIAPSSDGNGGFIVSTSTDNRGNIDGSYFKLSSQDNSRLFMDFGKDDNDNNLAFNVNSIEFKYQTSKAGLHITKAGENEIFTLKGDIGSSITLGYSDGGDYSGDGGVTITNEDIWIKKLVQNVNLGHKERASITEIIKTISEQITTTTEGLEITKDNLIADLSDERKKNIIGDNKIGLKEVSQMQVKNFTYKEDKEKDMHVGVIAQQLQKIMPEAIVKDKDGYLRVKKENIIYAVVNSVKELYQQVQDLVIKVSGLEKRITELETQNKKLKEQNEAFEKRLEAIEKKQTEIEYKK